MDDVDRLLTRVKRAAHGKLPLSVYRRIYETAATREGGTFVEIGTSQGAATIALALGAAASGKPFQIYSVDNFTSGSRPRGGSIAEKRDIVRRGLEAFGVSESIHLVAGTSEDLLEAAALERIDLLLIDADGRIERDLALFHHLLAPTATIIIDDIDDRTYLHFKGRSLLVDQKHGLTHRLVASFVEAGLIVPDGASGQTGWYAKGPAEMNAAEIERQALQAYRELVVAKIGLGHVGLKRGLYAVAAARAPWLAHIWRRTRAKG